MVREGGGTNPALRAAAVVVFDPVYSRAALGRWGGARSSSEGVCRGSRQGEWECDDEDRSSSRSVGTSHCISVCPHATKCANYLGFGFVCPPPNQAGATRLPSSPQPTSRQMFHRQCQGLGATECQLPAGAPKIFTHQDPTHGQPPSQPVHPETTPSLDPTPSPAIWAARLMCGVWHRICSGGVC